MSCFIPSVKAVKAGCSSHTTSFQAQSSPAKSTYKSGTTKLPVIIPENWYDEASDSEKSLFGSHDHPSVAVKALRARQFFRRISTLATDIVFFYPDGPRDWEVDKLQYSFMWMLQDLYKEREGEKEYPTDWVQDLPNDEKACVEGLADILGEEFTITSDSEANWEEHESRVGEYLDGFDPIPEEDQGLEELDLLED
ncbi:uncharacterized protein FPRO_08925 [Fusarium proliferatum ET1]|uniref:Uncharacterized protein n=1 Tax=Fusarium proliferatum (strain ET1) TaxID=1227346 RepID=A0A1L7W9R8_FUSPR|nr:uncharacterized protein FPRO_08925 [Fusarium proliferatum ET1]CZR49334.1 uncharacterized protein FPRO_08925 [Fusarium proliferatum ET1]